ncbi:MAG: tetratricopeptide repeat protein [Methanobacteriota archaeon]|nr:MAG: tetratricopeptide repeat protein [Euryarchaeota archaeon]
MLTSYKDRLEGGYRYTRIRRFRGWTAAGLILATSGLIAVSLGVAGASAKPLFMPLEAFLSPFLVMLFIGIFLLTFFRNLSIQYANKDAQRYLMIKNTMGRARFIVAIGLVIAVILLAPVTRGAMDGSATPPPVIDSLTPNEEIIFTFESEDPLGATRYTALTITLTVGGQLNLLVKRSWSTAVTDIPAPASILPASRSVIIGLDTDKPYTYAVTLLNPTTGSVAYSYQLRGSVFPALFSVAPGFAVALAFLSLGFFMFLRPRRDRFKQAAIYSGDFQVQVDSGERLYSEYHALRPSGRTFLDGDTLPPRPAPAPVVSGYPSANPGPDLASAGAPTPPLPPPPPPVAALPPRTPSELFGDAASLFSQGLHELAVEKFNEVLALEPRHTRALLGKGEALMRLGRTKEALDAYDEILRHDRGNLDALIAATGVYTAERRWRDVVDLADTVLAMKPGDPEMLVYRGDAQLALGKRSDAQISYEAALLKRPADPAILERIEKAKVDVAALQSRALIASASGNLDQAIALFDEVLKIEPENPNATVGKSVVLRRAGRVEDALASLEAVLLRQPGHGGALLNKGRILEERGDLEDALEAYDKLIEMNPRDADAWVAQGDVLGKMGREDDALKSYQEAVRIAPSDEDTQGKVTGMESSREQEATVLAELFTIKGIGPAKARALREAGFRTVDDFRKATEEALAQVRGITHKVAADIVAHFQAARGPNAQP